MRWWKTGLAAGVALALATVMVGGASALRVNRLPRVLLIGDSIAMGYADAVEAALRGKVRVSVIEENAKDTALSSEHLRSWLGAEPWDVVHFNWGLHDLKRPVERGFITNQVPLDDYRANLSRLLDAMDDTGAMLIFATTTPVRETAEPERTITDVVRYNRAALAVMNERQVVVDDLYAVGLPLGELVEPDGMHFRAEGSRILGDAVAQSILRQLRAEARPRVSRPGIVRAGP